jgi:hypothetical protein
MGKKSLLIGINYENSPHQLSGCINDVQAMKYFLLNNADYSPDSMTILTDHSILKPTRDNIERQMKALIANSTKGDILYLHYSGHGSKIRDNSGDEKDGNDEVIVPLDYLTASIITDDWIHSEILQKVPEGVFLFCTFDCCNSGSIGDLKYAWNYNGECKTNARSYNSIEWSNKFTFEVESKLECKGNIIVFSGCKDDQTSADVFENNTAGGAFTNVFIQFVKSHLVQFSNGKIIFDNAKLKYREVLKEINARLKLGNYSQRSVLSSSNIENFEKTISF